MSTAPFGYDFTAAGDLSYALAQLRAKLEDLVRTRGTGYDKDLGSPAHSPAPYYLWRGHQRDLFETDYQRDQKNLTDLISLLDTIQTQVRRATGDAVRAKRLYDLNQGGA